MSRARLSIFLAVQDGEVIDLRINHEKLQATGAGILTETTRGAARGVCKVLRLLRAAIDQERAETRGNPHA